MLQTDTIQLNTILTDTLANAANTADDTTNATAEAFPHVPCIFDSLFVPMDSVPEPVVRKSLFTHHELAVRSNHETTIRHEGTPGWFLGVIGLSICLICLFMRQKQIHITDLLTSAIDRRAMDRTLRDSNLTHAIDQAPIALIMLMPAALIGYYCLVQQSSNVWTSILKYLMVLGGCYVVYFLRNGLIRLLGTSFNNEDSVHLYLSSNYIYHLLYAIVIAAMSFFIFYTSTAGRTFLYITLGTVILLFAIRLIRGLQLILTNSKTSKLHLFYYLCILEIIPIIVIVKMIISY